ncbi:MAG: sialidase family protein [Planctomycetota bacterium]
MNQRDDSSARPLLLSCTIAIAITGSAMTAPTQKSPDVRLDDPTSLGASNAVQIAASGSSVYAIWSDGRNDFFDVADIYFSRSTDRGATWSPDVRLDRDLPGAAESRQPQVAVAGSAVYVVWADSRNGANDIYFNRSLDGGVTWLAADVRLDTDAAGASLSTTPQIAARGSDVYVVWTDARSSYGEIRFNRSVNQGGAWLSNDVQLDRGTVLATRPQIAAFSSAVYVTWEDARNGFDDIYFNRSLDNGATWLAFDVRLNTNTAGAAFSLAPQIASDGGSVFVTWQDARAGGLLTGDIYFNRSLDNGTTWLAADVRLNTDLAGTAPSLSPQIAAAGSSVYVTWRDARAAQADIYFNRSLDAGAAWLAADVRIDTDPGPGASLSPQIAASGSSVFVAWEDNRSGSPRLSDIYYSRSQDSGASWLTTDRRLNTGTPPNVVRALGPQIAFADDTAYVVWHDDRNGNEDAFFNIPFGMQNYGAGAAGSGGFTPTLRGSGQATIGQSINLDVADGLGGTSFTMLVGTQDVPGTPFQGGTLLVVPVLAVPFAMGGATGVAGDGALNIPLAIPNTPSSIGGALFFQAVLVDPGASQGISMSPGLGLWIG